MFEVDNVNIEVIVVNVFVIYIVLVCYDLNVNVFVIYIVLVCYDLNLCYE